VTPTGLADRPAAPAGSRALAVTAAVPVVLVNATAFIGQLAYLRQHVPWPVGGQVLVALALESIAVYLAFHAHAAQMKNDSSMRLRLASYAFGLVIGAMNYSHFAAVHWRPTVMAVGMLMMSALSPWLWGIHSRRVSRDRLMELGLVEEHAVRLGPARWMWHPLLSLRATSHAAWVGESSPARAIAWVDERRAGRARALRTVHSAPPVREIPAPPVQASAAPPALPDGAPPVHHAQEEAAPPVRTPRAKESALPVHGDGAPPVQAESAPPVHPQVVRGSATLHAVPSMTTPALAEEVIEGARQRLAGLPESRLPSINQLSRELDPTGRDRRRVARTLLEERRATPRLARAGRQPGLIAAPAGQLPGGAGARG